MFHEKIDELLSWIERVVDLELAEDHQQDTQGDLEYAYEELQKALDAALDARKEEKERLAELAIEAYVEQAEADESLVSEQESNVP